MGLHRIGGARSACLPLLSALLLTFAACGDTGPADQGEEEHESSSDSVHGSDSERDAGASKKDASTHSSDAGRSTSGEDAGRRDAGSASPVDAGAVKPPATGADSGARVDAGSTPRADAGASDTGGAAGTSVSGIPADELEMLRQVCVDEINMYRATLQLAPLARATPAQELCSDQGSKKDGDSKSPHSSAGNGNPCYNPSARPPFPGFQAQDTCPGWPVGGFGSATIADALKGCLKQMWAEGPPDPSQPDGGEAACIMQYFAGDTKCFLAHGHYINMKSTSSKAVSCGFYNMGSNTYWMNQDFL